MTESFDMKCENVTDFKDITKMYIDPNNTGKLIHDEIKTFLNDDTYKILKKILIDSTELEKHLSLRPDYKDKAKSVANIRKRGFELKKFDEKSDILLNNALAKYSSLHDFCDDFNFNDEPIPQNFSEGIPLYNTVKGKQFVLGRQRNLFDYYNDKNNFITLNSQFWDHKYLNDVFIECASLKLDDFNESDKFPIRIVLTKKLFNEPDMTKDINAYDTDFQKTRVLSKELCQFLKYTNCELFQSIEYKNIFFISKSSIVHNPENFVKVNSINDRYVINYYKSKYLKYKQKYLKLLELL